MKEVYSIELEQNVDRTIALFKKYYAFERKRTWDLRPFILVGILSLIVAVVGLVGTYKVLLLVGLTMLVIVFVWLLIPIVKYKVALDRMTDMVHKEVKAASDKFTFSFDQDFIETNSESASVKVNWSMIVSYVENQGDLYLYYEEGELYDIISRSILGKDLYDMFTSILKEKIELASQNKE